ncbi:hypothetical protein [Croceitalea rosinachiae]|uniref:Uncharacterized protein n=1 Tax=Croceitalea rosinachiae TaxID=3075596 RepID=A0ABU3A6V3_9FLAO|nr:hypothetical protein [Croceitalea sp. F388]MDT0605902.1 hypothetical protein [Croceitalea sp. F388]
MKTLNQVFNTIKKSSPILYWVVIIHFIFAIICLIGLAIDDRILLGINVWIKPLKFSISGGIYILTLGFLTTLYPFSKRKKNIITIIVSITLLIEIVIIIYQAARGVQSHYNISNPFDGILFAAMGILIAINVVIMVLFIFETIRLKLDTSKTVQWAILLGWIIVVIGSWIGGQMISQMAHNVGVADGGAGLPLVNWSTTAGDLRVAHFFGLHAIQVIPLFAFWVSKKWNTNTRNQLIAVTVFGLLYAGWIGHTFYQAKQGIALIQL